MIGAEDRELERVDPSSAREIQSCRFCYASESSQWLKMQGWVIFGGMCVRFWGCHSSLKLTTHRVAGSKLGFGLQLDIQPPGSVDEPGGKCLWSNGIHKRAHAFCILEEVQTIARIIGWRNWGTHVEQALELSSVRFTAGHVLEVLKLQRDKKKALRFFIWAVQKKGCAVQYEAFNIIVGLWDNSQAIKDFLNALRWLGRIDCRVSEAMFTQLVKGYGLAGMADAAYQTFEHMKTYGCSPNVISFTCLLQVLVQDNRLDIARNVYQQMRDVGCSPNARTYSTLIYGFCKSSRYVEASEFLYKMIEEDLIPEVAHYRLLIFGLLKIEKIEIAWELFQRLKEKGHPSDAVTANVLTSILCKAGYLYETLELLNETVAQGFVAPVICSSVVECLQKEGIVAVDKFQKAFMSSHLKPDAMDYNYMIEGFAIAGRFDEAFKLWDEMKQEGYKVGHVYRPSLLQAPSIAKGKCESNASEMVLKGMFTPDIFICRSLIDVFCKAGYMDQAFEVKSEMVKNGFSADYIIYRSLIAGLCLVERVEDAYMVMNEMRANGKFPDVLIYNTIINGLCKGNMVVKAFKLLDEMKGEQCSPDVYTVNILISSLCKAGKIDQAKKLLEDMTVEGCDGDGVTFSIFLNSFLKSGNWLAARQCLNSMMEEGWDPDVVTYTITLTTLCKTGHIEAAHKLMDEMWVSGVAPDAVTYVTMIHGLSRADKIVEACRLLGQAIAKDLIPADDAYSILVGCLSKAGKLQTASELPQDLAAEGGFLDLISSFQPRL